MLACGLGARFGLIESGSGIVACFFDAASPNSGRARCAVSRFDLGLMFSLLFIVQNYLLPTIIIRSQEHYLP